MTDNTHTILCGSCRVEAKGPADPQDHDMITCPNCGRTDSFQNVKASVKAFAEEYAGNRLQESLVKSVGRDSFLKITAKPIKNGPYPFIVNL